MTEFRTRADYRPYHSLFLPTLCVVLLACAFNFACGSMTTKKLRHQLAGRIVAIDPSRQQIMVSHSEIAGFMPAMTMPFRLKNTNVLQSLSKGDEISATLVVAGNQSWLEDVYVARKATGQSDPRDVEIGALPHEGDVVPNFTLVNQDGKRITLNQYRGKTLLITFIYTRCPLPDYCPLLSSNFAEVDKALQKDPGLYAKTHLLSVSFDSEHDTPAVLRSYGAAYTERYSDEKFEHWEFASGSAEDVKAITKFFGLQYAKSSDQFAHSMVTAIVSPDGKIVKIYRYSDWKPGELLNELRRTAYIS